MISILERRSIRKFINKEVEFEKIENILKAAMYAPSAGNQQGWRFIVVRNKDILEKLSLSSPYATPTKNAKICIIPIAILENLKYPAYWQQDLAACTENILLQAHNEGLGSVWLAVAPEEDRIKSVSTTLNLSNNEIPFALIPIGYSESTPAQPQRFDKNKIVYID